MMTDPIADMLTRIRNACMMKHERVNIPYSRFKEGVLKILVKEGFVGGYEMLGENAKKMLVVELKSDADGEPVVTTIR